ncbi:hypothetical protein ABW19_dt0208652 [Dactylella cylindrospora]|nr:hypothetical protein ABW19_dt0208652 [Dactylella cylindrospora]
MRLYNSCICPKFSSTQAFLYNANTSMFPGFSDAPSGYTKKPEATFTIINSLFAVLLILFTQEYGSYYLFSLSLSSNHGTGGYQKFTLSFLYLFFPFLHLCCLYLNCTFCVYHKARASLRRISFLSIIQDNHLMLYCACAYILLLTRRSCRGEISLSIPLIFLRRVLIVSSLTRLSAVPSQS